MTFRLAGLAVFATAAAFVAAAHAEDTTPLSEARAAVKGLAENLKPALVAALESGGPVAAIDACRQAAPTIAAEQSAAHGLRVGRTALKVRNVANEPDAWEVKVLEDFAAKMKAGAAPATLEVSETVAVGGEKYFRYMKAIPMEAKPCALCHGTEVKAEVAAEIAKRYPQDKAVGFVPGELRGAFTVTKVLK